MIEIEGITKRYDATTVVDDVSMAIEPRTIAVIVGTSGSGKTTLLRMINRLVEPTAGVDQARRRRQPLAARLRTAPQHRLRHPGPRPVSASHRGAEHRHRAGAARLGQGPHQARASTSC